MSVKSWFQFTLLYIRPQPEKGTCITRLLYNLCKRHDALTKSWKQPVPHKHHVKMYSIHVTIIN